MSRIPILPWLRIRQRIEVGRFALVPFEVKPVKTLPEELYSLARTLAPFREPGKRPLRHASWVEIDHKAALPQLDTDPDLRTEVFDFVEVAAFSALAARDFHRPAYTNRSQFTCVIAPAAQDDTPIVVTARRRDGESQHFWSAGEFEEQRPTHVPGGMIVDLDESLMRSLWALRGGEDWDRVFDAVEGFDLANTDDPVITEGMEIVLTQGAFQRLLGTGEDLGLLKKEVRKLYEFVAAERSRRLSAHGETASPLSCDPVVHWLAELNDYRKRRAHGVVRSSDHSPHRSAALHLLFASFFFPRLLKVHLHVVGQYVCKDQDFAEFEAFTRIVTWKPGKRRNVGDLDSPPPWDSFIEQASKPWRHASIADKWVEAAQKLGTDLPEHLRRQGEVS